jgi:hypothetical protein
VSKLADAIQAGVEYIQKKQIGTRTFLKADQAKAENSFTDSQ